MTTLREHLEAAIALEGEWPDMAFGEVLDHVHAALAILDEAERERNESRDPSNRYPLDRVLVEDPKPEPFTGLWPGGPSI